INAINNATGVRIYDLPASPEKVKAGIDAIAKGENLAKPEKYDLGSDFYEEMETLKNNPIADEIEGESGEELKANPEEA
ncbi:MAG: hypothetical protein LBD41_04780, partial [Clostridiales Family XIII bacterium]|nr:hypothetical protein [Clostridiales Family XIII bacterium]